MIPFTNHVTAMFAVPVTVAVNVSVAPPAFNMFDGAVTLTAIAGMTVSVVLPVGLGATALWAWMVTIGDAGTVAGAM